MRRRVRAASGPSSGPQPRASAMARAFNGETKPKSKPVPRDVPANWLSRLLAVSCNLPIENGPEAVACALLEAAAGIVPGHVFGLSVEGVLEQGQTGAARILRSSPKISRVSVNQRPERIFPGLAHERALEMSGEHEGIRLHVAGGDGAALREGTPILFFMGHLLHVLASALRTTRLVNAKRRESLELKGQIIQSEKLASLGQIAAGVVHELNNPLTSIVGYSDYLRAKAERNQADPTDIERLRRIGDAAGRILRFSSDLMAYARPSIEPPSPVPIHSVIDQALVFCEHLLGQASIQVDRAFASEVGPVLGVRDQLIQVFVNLFTNACHAMESHGGTLAVETAIDLPRRAVKITVADTGHGIDSQNLKHIFDPFFTTKTEGRGTGLGLSIVRKIVLLHGGVIGVNSTPRRGTTFVMELPSG